MIITVCIGSSCHIKGSKQVVEQLRALVAENCLDHLISLTGAFCMGECMNGVCVKIDDAMFSVQPENVETFFNTEVRSRLVDSEHQARKNK
ncbi:MAG: (2Fe-2S) ferredoxin domain-containing protein [Anaerovoracaceae bacterium]|jgi:NADH:ubiquinone oxidoreductase subunit E|nr:NAD(P)H-dependent oxidoreductase subunit E [Bacillota bacterium]HPZ60072.1 NAD(P)H-dependent oxidoreductase subunit E [Bacillota bacterium]